MSRQRQSVADPSKPNISQTKKDRRGTKTRLLEYHEIPSWQQENEYILTGYRPTSASVRVSLEGLLYLNNEIGKQLFLIVRIVLTVYCIVSTYSHIFGAALFAGIPWWLYGEIILRYPRTTIADVIVFSTFFYGVAACLALSAT